MLLYFCSFYFLYQLGSQKVFNSQFVFFLIFSIYLQFLQHTLATIKFPLTKLNNKNVRKLDHCMYTSKYQEYSMFVRTKRKLFVTQKDNRSINADLGALGVCVFFLSRCVRYLHFVHHFSRSWRLCVFIILKVSNCWVG